MTESCRLELRLQNGSIKKALESVRFWEMSLSPVACWALADSQYRFRCLIRGHAYPISESGRTPRLLVTWASFATVIVDAVPNQRSHGSMSGSRVIQQQLRAATSLGWRQRN